MRNNKAIIPKFSVVIPCKNEEKYISGLLASICGQRLQPLEIIIADGGSIDNTLNIIKWYKILLPITVVSGGNVSEGRNNGFCNTKDTKYIIFIDADMVIKDPYLFFDTIKMMEEKDLAMCTTNIYCSGKNLISKFMYNLNNACQRLSIILGSPFSTGSYMCIYRSTFYILNGFNENIKFCEDFWLSKQIRPERFGILKSSIYTSDRRFKKMGYFWMIKNFILSWINRNNIEFFKKDFKYWD